MDKQTTKIVNPIKLSVIGLETIKVVLVRIFVGVDLNLLVEKGQTYFSIRGRKVLMSNASRKRLLW